MVGRKVTEMDSLIDKVRQGLECHKDEIPGVCGKCPYFTESGFCSGRLAKDALSLLKEQDSLLKEYRNTIKDGYEALTNATKIIKSEPQIIRCKDCKWFDGEVCEVYGRHTGNFFCADGVKRDD